MSAALVPVYLAAAALLVKAALAKLADPEPAAAALAEIGLRPARSLARAGALLELAVATGMVVRPAVGALAGSALYLSFGALVATQIRRGTRSCGCFGAAEMPPAVTHVALDLVLAGVCAVARPDPLGMLVHHPTTGSVVFVAAAATAWGVAAALELAPPALTAYRRPTA